MEKTRRLPPGQGVPWRGMRSNSPDEHLDRLASLDQELDDLYGHLGLPKPKFGELSVRRLKGGDSPESSRRTPHRSLRKA